MYYTCRCICFALHCSPEKARLYRYGVRHRMPDDVMAIHRRLADKTDYYVTRPSSARRCIWIKAAGHLGETLESIIIMCFGTLK